MLVESGMVMGVNLRMQTSRERSNTNLLNTKSGYINLK